MQRLKKALLTVIILVISGCGSVRYVTAPLPIPQKPDMPYFIDKDLECLPESVYYRVAGRDLAHKNYEERLESVIKSTWSDK